MSARYCSPQVLGTPSRRLAADLSPLVDTAPIGAEMLVVVARDQGGEEFSGRMVAEDSDGSSVSFGPGPLPGTNFRGLVDALDRASG
ncbi:MAG: hypothetical protein IPG46_05260 [Actinobacteria bacterium]|nr:hypothetical protein [Actinomycetota bacterium]